MIEPLIEGGGCIFGLAALYYFEIWRPARRAAQDRADTQPVMPVTSTPSEKD